MQGIWKDMPHPFFRLQRKSIRMQALHAAGDFFHFPCGPSYSRCLFGAGQRDEPALVGTPKKRYDRFILPAGENDRAGDLGFRAIFRHPQQYPFYRSHHFPPCLLYGHLTTALRSTPCSGAYLVLDATTNTQAPGAQNSRAGLYLRLANLCSKSAANQDIVFYRGVADVAREHQLELHNRWKLEFDADLPARHLGKCDDTDGSHPGK